MDAKKKRKLQKLSGRVTTVAEFLDLSAAEEVIIEVRLELAAAVKKRRTAARMTQAALAKAIGSTQARVAKMEAGDAGEHRVAHSRPGCARREASFEGGVTGYAV